jgi:hypothetical protein
MIEILLWVFGLILVIVSIVSARHDGKILRDLQKRVAELEALYEDDDPDPDDGEPKPNEACEIIAIGKKAA